MNTTAESIAPKTSTLPRTIDFYTYAFRSIVPEQIRFDTVRKLITAPLEPLRSAVDEGRSLLRAFPVAIRETIAPITRAFALPHLLLEGSFEDLHESLSTNNIDAACVYAKPPLLNNNALLEIASKDSRLIPIVAFESGLTDKVFREYLRKGAKGLAIKRGPSNLVPNLAKFSHSDIAYIEMNLRVAREENCPIILFPLPRERELIENWIRNFPKVQFVLAQMNSMNPQQAYELGGKYPNVYAEISHQPVEAIAEALRVFGKERVLFGSGWPAYGNAHKRTLNRLDEMVKTKLAQREDLEFVMGRNAAKLLKLEGK